MTVSDSRDQPVYLKLRGMIAMGIIDGNYQEGAQLPSVRAFASVTQTNPLTVAKAYQSLQDDGYVEVKRGVGMFVVDGAATRLRAQERDMFLNQIWPAMRKRLDSLGISHEELFAAELAN